MPGCRSLPAVAIAVAAVAITAAIGAVAVRGIAVVAVRGGIAAVSVRGIAVVAVVAVAVAIAIGGGLGGGKSGRAERGGGGDRDEGVLEGVHVHLLRKKCRTVAARPTRRPSH